MNPTPRRPWLVPLILGFSLGCNALLGAFVMTQQVRSFMADRPEPSLADRRPGQAIRAMIARLPPDDAATIRAAFRPHAAEIAAAGRKLILARQQVREDLGRTELDSAGFEQAMTAMAAARRELADIVQQTLVPALERLSPEGRRAVAEWPQRR